MIFSWGGGGLLDGRGMVVQAGPFLGRSGGRRMADKHNDEKMHSVIEILIYPTLII